VIDLVVVFTDNRLVYLFTNLLKSSEFPTGSLCPLIYLGHTTADLKFSTTLGTSTRKIRDINTICFGKSVTRCNYNAQL